MRELACAVCPICLLQLPCFCQHQDVVAALKALQAVQHSVIIDSKTLVGQVGMRLLCCHWRLRLRLQESEAWLLLLLELVPVLGPEQLLAQVLSLALAHGEVNETVDSRVVCCRLLGAITPHLVGATRAAVQASCKAVGMPCDLQCY